MCIVPRTPYAAHCKLVKRGRYGYGKKVARKTKADQRRCKIATTTTQNREAKTVDLLPAKQTQEASEKMNAKDFDKKQFEISVQAGMNQRYHQGKATHWARFDRTFRILIGVLAVASAMLSVVTASNTEVGWWVSLSIVLSSSAAVIGLAINVLPFADWEKQHVDLFRRWSDLREDIDAMPFDFAKQSEEACVRLRTIEAKMHRICAMEPAPNDSLLDQCFAAEQRSRRFAEEEVAPAT